MSPNQLPPLAERMRPKQWLDFSGQQHLIGPGKVLRNMIDAGKLASVIFWGPPGVGKTSLARFIAGKVNLPFYALSAIDSGVKEVRAVIEGANENGRVILFVDEIHRFNKSQQDALLGAVERGTITLIGATTENPSFEVIPALLSRCQVYVLKPLEKEDLENMLVKAITEDEVLKNKKIELTETSAILKYSGGDGRKLLNVLELVVEATRGEEVKITNKITENVIQQRISVYDKGGEHHYDIVSAFIKSIRGSDPNAALYYLARMILGGEDPKFIARRMLILAAEDIGNANPTALVLATTCFQAVTMIGYPECELILSQTVIYLATSSKSNSALKAIHKAKELVKQTGDLPVPLPLRNAPTKLMKDLNYGENYQYAHDFTGNFVLSEFLPDKIAGTTLFIPGENAREKEIRNQLRVWWKEKYGY